MTVRTDDTVDRLTAALSEDGDWLTKGDTVRFWLGDEDCHWQTAVIQAIWQSGAQMPEALVAWPTGEGPRRQDHEAVADVWTLRKAV